MVSTTMSGEELCIQGEVHKQFLMWNLLSSLRGSNNGEVVQDPLEIREKFPEIPAFWE